MTRPGRLVMAIAGFAAIVVLVAILAGAWAPAPRQGTPSPSSAALPSGSGASPGASAPGSPAPSAAGTPIPTALSSFSGWKTVIDDQFDGDLPGHWSSYDGPYKSGAQNCAIPSHATTHDGYLDVLFAYEASGVCGPGWYSGGLAVSGFSSIDARVTVRFRVVQTGGITAHRIIPMRWPDDEATWPAAGEEDSCEGASLIECSTVMHFDATNLQDSHDMALDLTQWHTIAVERRDHVVTVQIDGTLMWTYAGSETTLPTTLKHVVLQQECQATCPTGTTGTEDILVDFVTVEVPR